MNTNDFIKKAREIHGDKYDYSKVNYINSKTKVCIICPKHGEFLQIPFSHLNGMGCKKCADSNNGINRRNGVNTFIERSQKIHENKYNYSKVEYTNLTTKVCIICLEHGEFWQTPKQHLRGEGCPKCAVIRRAIKLKKEKKIKPCKERNADKRDNIETFIEKANKVHNEKYNYSKTIYVNSRTDIIVICPIHGEFHTTPHKHIHNKHECPQCLKEKKDNKIKPIKKDKNKIFVEKAKLIHGDKYNYSNINYINKNTKICIICPEHGEFWQIPHNHLKGCGCPKCAREILRKKHSFTKDIFIMNAKKIHENKYDYSKVEYINNSTKVCIICPKHGEFWQTPAMHYNERQGCPLCGTLSSKNELEIFNILKKYFSDVHLRDHDIIKPKEIEITIPSKKVCIEYNGLRWHSEEFKDDKNYHLNKSELCKQKGYNLIHIFEDEWIFKKEIVKNKLLHILDCDYEKEKIYGRKIIVKEINHNEGKDFLEKNHIQGSTQSTLYIGGFYNNTLISVMSFIKFKNEWILNRFASIISYNCVGVGGKLFNFFIKKYNPTFVKTYADKRWTITDNNFYTKIGFIEEAILPPNYYYVTSEDGYRHRYHKFNFRKNKILKKYGDKYDLNNEMSEREMAEKVGLHRIYDCGLLKYIWKKEN